MFCRILRLLGHGSGKCCKTRIHLQRSVPLQPKGFVVTKWHEAAASPRPILTVILNDGHRAEARDSGWWKKLDIHMTFILMFYHRRSFWNSEWMKRRMIECLKMRRVCNRERKDKGKLVSFRHFRFRLEDPISIYIFARPRDWSIFDSSSVFISCVIV